MFNKQFSDQTPVFDEFNELVHVTQPNMSLTVPDMIYRSSQCLPIDVQIYTQSDFGNVDKLDMSDKLNSIHPNRYFNDSQPVTNDKPVVTQSQNIDIQQVTNNSTPV